jgi:SAM-dependent methyltransferase
VDTIAGVSARSTGPADRACRLCGASSTSGVGTVHGSFSGQNYDLRRCISCGFTFIADPWTDFARIYDDSYYTGHGADPLVDYGFELTDPDRTVRQYEWRGITRCVSGLMRGLDGVRWLDFGCGNGGLVRHLRLQSDAAAVGFEEGSIASRARELGIPILQRDELAEHEGRFDVVTAIEVLEHTVDPIRELREIRQLMRPGGLLFVTTGNTAPFVDRLTEWRYVTPEIHISFFDPQTLGYAMRQAGFRPEPGIRSPGFDEILKFKVLKNLRVRRRNALTDAIPSRLLAALAEPRVRLSSHPVGWAV